jgi:hypothetical protein
MKHRFDRQQFLGPHSEHILARTRIAVAGLGGGGSHIVQQGAHVGIGEFCVFDPDHVEDSNLNRLVGATEQDAAEMTPKVVVAKRAIQAVNPHASVITGPNRWQADAEMLRTCAVVFGCVDRFDEREELEGYCRRFLIPYIDVGMDVHAVGDQFAVSGQVILSLPGGPCMRCMGFFDGDNDEKPAYLDAGARPQVIWPNGVLASTAIGVFMQLFTPWSKQLLSPYLEYDGNSHQIRRSKQLDFIEHTCPHFPEEAVGDPFWTLTSHQSPIGNHH